MLTTLDTFTASDGWTEDENSTHGNTSIGRFTRIADGSADDTLTITEPYGRQLRGAITAIAGQLSYT